MKKYIFLIILAFIILFSLSCKKPSEENPNSIQAGIYNSNFEYHEFQPPFQLNPIWEHNLWVANADSSFYIKLGADSVQVEVLLKYINVDSILAITKKDSSIIQTLSLQVLTNFGLHQTGKEYYVGLGKATEIFSATAYEYGSSIVGNESEFLYGNTNSYKRWCHLWEMPKPMQGTILNYDGGQWYNLTETRYVGFIFNGHLGWIKIDVTNPNQPIFISYAIKK